MSIKTSVAPATIAEVIVQTSAKVIAAVVAQVQTGISLLSKKRVTAETVLAEANRLGYDKKQASAMVALCWVEAFGLNNAPEAEQKAFMLKSRPDVSKVITLAYPAKPSELAKAYAHNDKLPANSPKANRIGENTLLEIARGNLTFAQAMSKKAPAQSSLNAVSTPQERFAASCKGMFAMHKVGEKNRITRDEATQAFNDAIELYCNPPKAVAAKPAKPAK